MGAAQAWVEDVVRRFKDLDDNASHTPDVRSCHCSDHSTTSGAAECALDWNSGTEVNRHILLWASNENAAQWYVTPTWRHRPFVHGRS